MSPEVRRHYCQTLNLYLMAKGIAINGQLRGKLGGVVYYRSNGQQISRARAENVSNPNTQPQRIQRMIMATVMQAYSLTKEITDHSFEGIKYKQDSMAFFQRVNANKLRSMISAENAAFDPSFTAPKVQALVPNGYTISRGSLSPVPYSFKAGAAGANYPVFGFGTAAGSLAAWRLSTFLEITGSQPGDMVTLVWFDGDSVLYSLTDGENDRQNIKYVTMRYVRIKFKDSYTTAELAGELYTPNATTHQPEFNSSLFDTELSSNLSLMNDCELHNEDNDYFLGFPNIDAHAIGVIRSRRDGGVWRRSLCEMTCNPGYHYGLSYEAGLLAWENNTNELGNGDWLLNDKKEGVNP